MDFKILAVISLGLACFFLGLSIGRLVTKERTTISGPEPTAVSAPVDTLSEWQALTLAIAITESKCNPSATGKTQDYGILQLTPIYVKEANRVGGTVYAHEDAYDPLKSLLMFRAVQDYYNPEHDLDKAIKLHNPRGASIGYTAKVKSNLEFIKRYEAARRAVIDYELRKGI